MDANMNYIATSIDTRMNSSRMRTAHSLTACRLGGGGGQGASIARRGVRGGGGGHAWQGGIPVNRMTGVKTLPCRKFVAGGKNSVPCVC